MSFLGTSGRGSRSARLPGEHRRVAASRSSRPAGAERPRSRQPPAASSPRFPLARFIPPTRVLVAGAVVVALAVGGLMLARKSSMFAVRSIDVRGAPPAVSARIRATLERWRGTSLVGLDGRELVQSLDALPLVASASLDRDFPHTLRVRVAPERAVAVLRRGLQAWLVSARGRVLHRTALRSSPHLPRI